LATTIRTERRKRGIIGRLFLFLFWLFNILMLIWLIGGLASTGDSFASATSEAQKAGAAIGTAIGMGLILAIWAAGALILGLIVAMTPGKTVITETTKD
jgi:hypothetical protein